MFRDLPSVYALDIEFQSAPLGVQIKAMRDQLDMLKSLDDAPLFGPGLHQMDGDIGESSLDPALRCTSPLLLILRPELFIDINLS